MVILEDVSSIIGETAVTVIDTDPVFPLPVAVAVNVPAAVGLPAIKYLKPSFKTLNPAGRFERSKVEGALPLYGIS